MESAVNVWVKEIKSICQVKDQPEIIHPVKSQSKYFSKPSVWPRTKIGIHDISECHPLGKILKKGSKAVRLKKTLWQLVDPQLGGLQYCLAMDVCPEPWSNFSTVEVHSRQPQCYLLLVTVLLPQETTKDAVSIAFQWNFVTGPPPYSKWRQQSGRGFGESVTNLRHNVINDNVPPFNVPHCAHSFISIRLAT